MRKIFISMIIVLWFIGCSTYQQQALPDASDIVTQHKLNTLDKRNNPYTKSLSAISNEVMLYNPDLRSMRYDLNISDALVFNAGLLPDPSLGFSIATPIGGTGLSDALGAGLGWSLGSLFTRANEVSRAKAERNVTIARYAWQAHLNVAKALVLAGRLNYLKEQEKIATKNLALSQQLSEITSQKASVYDETISVKNSRRMAMLDALDIQAKINDQIISTQYELNYLLGLPPSESFNIISFELVEIHPDPSSLFNQAIEKRDDLVARRFAYEASDAVYRRNILAQFPSFALSLNWSSDTSKIKTFGPSITFDFPLWNRNQGGIVLSSTLRDKEKEDYSVALERTQNDIVAIINAINRNQELYIKAKHESIENQKLEHALDQALKNSDLTLNDYVAKMNEIYLKELWIIGLKQTIFEQQIALSLASGSNTILGEYK